MTSERDWDAVDAVQHYKELADVERSFRYLKDVLALRPVYHQVKLRVAGHIFVAFLAFLLERLLAERLRKAGLGLSATQAVASRGGGAGGGVPAGRRKATRRKPWQSTSAAGFEGAGNRTDEAADAPGGAVGGDVVTNQKWTLRCNNLRR